MTHPPLTIPSTLYRPKKLPRVIRRQYFVMRAAAVVAVIFAAGIAIAWRNILYERLTIDIARQRAEIEVLEQEISHLNGMVKTAASYTVVESWAAQQYGWKPIQGCIEEITLPASSVTPEVRKELAVKGGSNE